MEPDDDLADAPRRGQRWMDGGRTGERVECDETQVEILPPSTERHAPMTTMTTACPPPRTPPAGPDGPGGDESPLVYHLRARARPFSVGGNFALPSMKSRVHGEGRPPLGVSWLQARCWYGARRTRGLGHDELERH